MNLLAIFKTLTPENTPVLVWIFDGAKQLKC